MPITACCPSCEFTFRVKDEHAGKLARCSSCQQPVRIPKAQPFTESASQSVSRPAAAKPTKSVSAAPAPRPRRSVAADRGSQNPQGIVLSPKMIVSGIVGTVVLAVVTAFVIQKTGQPAVNQRQANQNASDAGRAMMEDAKRRHQEIVEAMHQRSLNQMRGNQNAKTSSNNTRSGTNVTQPPQSTPDTSVATKDGTVNGKAKNNRFDPETLSNFSRFQFKSPQSSKSAGQPVSTAASPESVSAANSIVGVQNQPTATSPSMKETGIPMSWADLNELIEPSVVKVNVTSAEGGCTGSGFVIDSAGLAVTNYHVVEAATAVSLEFANKDTLPVTGYLHLDPDRDIAIVQFDVSGASKPLRALPLAAQIPRKGEEVAAFGAPLGLDFTFSQSNVSAIRSAKDLENILGLENNKGTWVQHSTPISPGNSGGPLVNRRGEVVAINTLILTTGQNLNFAISAEDISKAMQVKRTAALPVVAASAPAMQRSSGAKPGDDPFSGREREAIDLTDDERGQKLLAQIDEMSLLILQFTLDHRGTVSGAVRDAARQAIERSSIKLRSLKSDSPVLLIAMALERSGQKSSLRMSAHVLVLDSSNADLLKLWEKTEDVGTISEQSLRQGLLPPNLRRDITDYFDAFRRDLAKARRSFPTD